MSRSTLTRRAALGALAALPLSGAAARLLAAQQPHMTAALAGLHEAKRHLELASPDKGGHRIKAIKACNEAIDQTEKGIRAAS